MYACTIRLVTKMAAILQTAFLIFFNENIRKLIEISSKCVPSSPINNKSALVR